MLCKCVSDNTKYSITEPGGIITTILIIITIIIIIIMIIMMTAITFHNHYNQRIIKSIFNENGDVGTSKPKKYVNKVCCYWTPAMIIRFV